MGRENYKKTLEQQIYARMQRMLTPGRSRHEDKRDGIDKDHIYSYKTYHTYKTQISYFVKWLKREHPDAKTMKYARPYYREYMEYLESQGYAPSSLHTSNAALMKVFGIDKTEKDFYHPPVRHKEDFQRSRGEKASDVHFNPSLHEDIINFTKGCGFRDGVLEKVTGADYFSRADLEVEVKRIAGIPSKNRSEKEQALLNSSVIVLEGTCFDGYDDFVFHYNDKHGKSRLAPIIGDNKAEIIERFKKTAPNKKVWEHVPTAMDVHNYRRDYATSFYKAIARDIKDIPYDKVNKGTGRKYQSGVYYCRLGDKGRKLDRAALEIVSCALGHNRTEVVPRDYLKDF